MNLNAILMNNQIKIMENFFLSEDKNLLINQVNEEVGEFYIGVLKNLSEEKSIRLVFQDIESQGISQSLFEDVKIKLCKTTQSKKIEEAILSNEKKIIVTDYRNWKKYSSKCLSVNGYKFKEDLKYILEYFFTISNKDLFNFCQQSPALACSEIKKYLINSKDYKSDTKIIYDENYLINIRKDIFSEKKQNKNLQKLFARIKREVIYKKFNFLTF